MSKSLRIRMSIPLPSQPIVPVSSFTFGQWLPLGEEDSITVREDNIAVTLSFDLGCLSFPYEMTEDDLSKHFNVLVHVVRAEVSVDDVADELADFIMSTDYYRRGFETIGPQEQRLIDEYGALGDRIYLFAIGRVNRLISYARVQKGQYWLEEYATGAEDTSRSFVSFEPEVTADGSEWLRWVPPNTRVINVPPMDPSRYIVRDDWEKVGEYVGARSRPPLVGELLAGAESLAGNGHTRSALTEAVTALEVAVSQFSRQPRAEQAFGSVYADRLGLSSLENQVSRLGLSATVNYLLPLLFTEEQIPTETLRTCKSAVARRQMVVHQGQRDVREDELHSFLIAIRQLCSVLDSYRGD